MALPVIITRLIALAPMFIMPIIVLAIWAVLFYNGSPFLTQIIINILYLFLGIPFIVLVFLSIPLIAFSMYFSTSQYLETFYSGMVIAFFVFTIIIQYFYIKKTIRIVEEREQMPILQVVKREFNSDYRKNRLNKRKQTVKENVDFFDKITEHNKEKRQKEREERERLRKALTQSDV